MADAEDTHCSPPAATPLRARGPRGRGPRGNAHGAPWHGHDHTIGQIANRSDEYLSVRYAVGLGVDIINMSFGALLYKDAQFHPCDADAREQIIDEIDTTLAQAIDGESSKWNVLQRFFREEAACLSSAPDSNCLDPSQTMIVNAASNCNIDLGVREAEFIDWPTEMPFANHVAVTSANSYPNPGLPNREPLLEIAGAFGEEYVDIVAPLPRAAATAEGGTEGKRGNSFAAPYIAGTLGLVLGDARASGASTAPSDIIARVLEFAETRAEVHPSTAGNSASDGANPHVAEGRYVNVYSAISETSCLP